MSEWKYRPDPSHIKIRKLGTAELFNSYFMLPAYHPPWRWQINYGLGRTCLHASLASCWHCYDTSTATTKDSIIEQSSLQLQRFDASPCQ